MPTNLFAPNGYRSVLGIGKETTFGTAASPTIFLPFADHNIGFANKVQFSQSVRQGAGRPAPTSGTMEVKGTVSTYVDVSSIAPILAYALGKDAVSGTADPYTHTMNLATGIPALTFSADDGQGIVEQYVGCKIGGIDISCKEGDFLMAKLDVQGQTVAPLTASSLSPTFAVNDFIEFNHLSSANSGSGVSTLQGTPYNFTDFNIQVKTNMKYQYGSIAGRVPVSINDLMRQVSGSFTVTYDQSTADAINQLLWGAATGPTNGPVPRASLVFTFSQSTNRSISFQLGNITLTDAVVNRKANDLLMQQVKFVASESAPGQGDDIKVIIKNAAATAYLP